MYSLDYKEGSNSLLLLVFSVFSLFYDITTVPYPFIMSNIKRILFYCKTIKSIILKRKLSPNEILDTLYAMCNSLLSTLVKIVQSINTKVGISMVNWVKGPRGT